MIKDQMILLKVSNKTKKYYEKIKNSKLNTNEYIEVSVFNLQLSSHLKIIGICDFCGKERSLSYKSYNSQTNNNQFKFSCSKKCSIIKTNETNLKKFGKKNVFQSEIIKKKIENSKLKKYGDSKYVNRELAKKTNILRYGFEYPSSSNDIKEKKRKTNFLKFGVEYPSQDPKTINKMIETCKIRYGFENFSKTDIFKEKIKEKNFNKMFSKISLYGTLIKSENGKYFINCNNCKMDFEILQSLKFKREKNGYELCTHCNPLKQNIKQNNLNDFIEKYYSTERNNREVLNGKELDIYLPHLKLGFEFNGLYWHSEIFKEKDYHLNKTNECLEKGIQLIHIWEDDWDYKQDIVKSIILNKLGKNTNKIYGRKCQIKEISDNKIVKRFLEENHIQGFVGSKIKLGLYYNNELVSLMTFGNLRRNLGQRSKEGSYELLRFCNVLNTSVIGGASKLFKYFIKNYDVKEIISYSDNSRSNGNLYKVLGFKNFNETINYYWIKNGIRHHRFNFRKDKLVKEGFNKNLSEIEIMYLKGFYRLFDSGVKKWIFIK